jgi:hypothetical protein
MIRETAFRDPEIKAFFERLEVEAVAKVIRKLILRMGRQRFGPAPPDVEEAINSITDLARLEALIERLLDVSSWAEMLAE